MKDIELRWSKKENDLEVTWKKKNKPTALFVLDLFSKEIQQELIKRGYDLMTLKLSQTQSKEKANANK